jgi:hypothetical protein
MDLCPTQQASVSQSAVTVLALLAAKRHQMRAAIATRPADVASRLFLSLEGPYSTFRVFNMLQTGRAAAFLT